MENKPNYDKAEREAKKMLKELGITDIPIIIDDIINHYGVNVSYKEFPDNLQDISGFIDVKEKRIYINYKDSLERQNFTKAHEFGHYVLHRDLFEKDPSKQLLLRQTNMNDTKEEKEANAFASELLIPKSILKNVISEYSGNGLSVKKLAYLFSVSLPFMAYRVQNALKY
jgi:Zn-dependent peptidase ImmA (M78 family)